MCIFRIRPEVSFPYCCSWGLYLVSTLVQFRLRRFAHLLPFLIPNRHFGVRVIVSVARGGNTCPFFTIFLDAALPYCILPKTFGVICIRGILTRAHCFLRFCCSLLFGSDLEMCMVA